MRLVKRAKSKTQHMFDHACDANIVEKEDGLVTVEIADGYSDAEFFLSMAPNEARSLAQRLVAESDAIEASKSKV